MGHGVSAPHPHERFTDEQLLMMTSQQLDRLWEDGQMSRRQKGKFIGTVTPGVVAGYTLTGLPTSPRG